MTFRFGRMIIAGMLAAGLFAASAQAQERMVEGEMAAEAVKYRKNIMSAMGAHMASIGAILQGKVANKDDLAAHASALSGLAGMWDDLFPKGSVLPESRLKPEFFDHRDEVNGIIKALQEAGEKVATAAQAGDMAAVGQNLGAMGQQCGACHRNYRMPAS